MVAQGRPGVLSSKLLRGLRISVLDSLLINSVSGKLNGNWHSGLVHHCPEGAFVWQTFKKSMSVRPRPRPRKSVVLSKPTSTRDMIFAFIYSSQWKKLDFRAVQIFEDRTKYRSSFSFKVFKNIFLSFIYPSQKSKLTHFVTKRVLVDTDKTLIILYFWPFWRLSDPSDVGLTYPIWTQLQTFERFPHKSPFGATLAPRE